MPSQQPPYFPRLRFYTRLIFIVLAVLLVLIFIFSTLR